MLGEGARESEGEGKQFFCNRLWEERDQWVKGDIVHVLTNFHRNGFLPKGSNAAFIALIPKKVKSTGAEGL